MFGIDLVPLIKSIGYLGIFTCILLENGVLLFFWLPGDSLLLTAGFLAGQGVLDIDIIVIGGFFTAIFGYIIGYYLGRHHGLPLFDSSDKRYARPEYLEKARRFYARWGNLALVMARFLPLRSFVCFLAGMTEMRYATFMFYNVIGAVAWAVVLPLLGFYLGKMITLEHLHYIGLVPVAGVLATIVAVPAFLHLRKAWKRKNPPAP